MEGDGKLIAIDYWFNDEPRQRITIDPAESVDKSDIVIPMDGVKPRTISEEYTFDATTKMVKTTETITVGIQVVQRRWGRLRGCRAYPGEHDIHGDPVV